MDRPERTGPAMLDPVAAVLMRELPSGAQSLLQDYRDRVGDQTAVYLSTPITTGPRLLAAMSGASIPENDAFLQNLRHEVMAENLLGVKPLRRRLNETHRSSHVIDPTDLDIDGWGQRDYHRFWVEVLRNFVAEVVFADGWQASTGCTLEYLVATDLGIPCFNSDLTPLGRTEGQELIKIAIGQIEAAGLDASIHRSVLDRLVSQTDHESADNWSASRKDDRLAHVAKSHNVASFASFAPGNADLRHLVVNGVILSSAKLTLEQATSQLMSEAATSTLNVRTFTDGPSKGLPFHYGLSSIDQVCNLVREHTSAGLYCIVNETVDVHDGGVSGVSLGGIVEFSPDDTPRAVERTGTVSLPIAIGRRILSTVYSAPLEIPSLEGSRYEFSVHPQGVGYRKTHVLVWEVEHVSPVALRAEPFWPNDFSRLVGDKTFGLLLAHSCGARVPTTRVVSRRVAPFEFGSSTGTYNWWMRTAPAIQTPGHFTTTPKWVDPFQLLEKEDRDGDVAAVLAQEGVRARYSGATAMAADGTVVVEGVAGEGDAFMLGLDEPVDLPEAVVDAVSECVDELRSTLGAVRIEWAHDGTSVWVLQMHRTNDAVGAGVLNPGDAADWLTFRPSDGLERLREIIALAIESSMGIEVTEPVGLTSHVGDLVRRAGVPARLRA